MVLVIRLNKRQLQGYYSRPPILKSKSGQQMVSKKNKPNNINKLIGRSGEIRTPDPLVPNQMRYQAALHSDVNSFKH